LQIGAAKIGAGEVGALQMRAAQIGADKSGASRSRVLELRLKVEMVAPNLAQRTRSRLGEIGPIEMGGTPVAWPSAVIRRWDPKIGGLLKMSMRPRK
jgi:hypothetical protein